MHVFWYGKRWRVVFVFVLEDTYETEHVKVIFVVGAFEGDILHSLVSLLRFEFKLMNLADFRLLIFEKVSQRAIPYELDYFDHNGQKVQ